MFCVKHTFSYSLFIYFFIFNSAYADNWDDDAGAGNSKDLTPVYRVYEDVELTSITKYNYGANNVVVKSVYPQLSSDALNQGVDDFNDLTLEIVKDEIAKFKRQVKERHTTQKKSAKNSLYIDYDTSVIKLGRDHLISIRYSMQGYISGMAHPYHYHRTFNFNLDKSQSIELTDLFATGSDYLAILSDYTKNRLDKRLGNKEMIAEGTAPTDDNFKNWNIKPYGLFITFDEYQVAPYASGTQTVLVPFSVLKPVIAADSPLSFCVRQAKKCGTNHLLTGGFIDEAINTNHRSLNPLLG